jgi:hypothetical protein
MVSFFLKYDKQDQLGTAAFNERDPNTIQQQESATKNPGGPRKNRTGQKAEHGTGNSP